MEYEYPEGATPLDPNESEGLLLTHISTRSELDRWEQDNINEAIGWLEDRKPKQILTEAFIKQLHKRMFGNVWRWAGNFRTTDKNIGVSKFYISIELKKLCDDVEYWIEHKVFSADEIAVRFHHKLVMIHLFPNGNGRHARLMADALLEYILNCPRFSWGSESSASPDEVRKKYIEALKSADRDEYGLLMEFVRS